MEDREDFSYFVKFGTEPWIHIREVKPKDFYFAQILRTKEASLVPLLVKLVQNPEVVWEMKAPTFRKFVNWSIENILNESVLEVENWLEVAFHLSKQRWGSHVDWLEDQPMSKIRAMIDITEKFVEAQNDSMKGK